MSVIGNDDRIRIMDTGTYPWRAICSIRARWGSRLMVGTGFLIGPRTVLTSGHVVFPQDPHTYPDQVEVIPGLSDAQQPFGSLSPVSMEAAPGWVKANEISQDLGILTLGADIGARIGWFGLGLVDTRDIIGRSVWVTGYPGEKRSATGATGDASPMQAAQLWHSAGVVVGTSDGRIFFDNDTTAGQTGAPVYLAPSNSATPIAIGLHAYGTQTSSAALGPANSGPMLDRAKLRWIYSIRSQTGIAVPAPH